MTNQPELKLSRHQPCGCVICICDTDDQCLGCGAKMCNTTECVFRYHPEKQAYEVDSQLKPIAMGDIVGHGAQINWVDNLIREDREIEKEKEAMTDQPKPALNPEADLTNLEAYWRDSPAAVIVARRYIRAYQQQQEQVEKAEAELARMQLTLDAAREQAIDAVARMQKAEAENQRLREALSVARAGKEYHHLEEWNQPISKDSDEAMGEKGAK